MPPFTAPGETTYTVPHDVGQLHVVAIGEDGAPGATSTVNGGQGARVEGILEVTPGQILNIFVDVNGGPGGAIQAPPSNAGGDGGGASGIRRGGTHLIVGAGGGGGGGSGLAGGGAGGTTPAPPNPPAGGTCAAGGAGAAATGAPAVGGQGGGGGGCTSGGAGGEIGGTDGSTLQGGTGGEANIATGGGGGGGAGHFGGGAGGSGIVAGGGGGGGGGSSFIVTDSLDNSFESNGAKLPSVTVTERATGPGNTQCSDGIDNDGDGLVDLNDPGCDNAADNDETDPTPLPQCSDTVDNDGDTRIDRADPGCHFDRNPNNDNSFVPQDNDERDEVPQPQCSDGLDNDGDGLVDLADPDCQNASDDDEGDGPTQPQCSDGLDNDGDGLVDLADPDCANAGDNDEGDGGALSDLTVTLHPSKSRVRSGRVGFTVTVRNNGPDTARNVEVTTVIDKGKLVFKALTGNGCNAPAPTSQVVRCRIDSLPSGQSVIFVVETKAKGRGKARVDAEAVLTEGQDLAPSDNKDRETIRIRGRRGKRR